MAVRKLKGSWWVDFCFHNQRYRKRSPINSKSGAEAYEVTLRQKIAHGESLEVTPAKESTFQEFAQDWFKTYAMTNNKPSEQRNKRIALDKHLIPWFGETPLKGIGLAEIERFKQAKVQEGLKAKTINNLLCVLSRCLGSAVDWELLEHVPRIKPLKVQPQSFDFLSPEESSKLIESCDEPMWKQMILLALRTGMRLGELFALDWTAVDLARRMVTVRQSYVRGHLGTPKSNKIRYIPLTDDVCRALYEGRKPSGLIFHQDDGAWLTHHIAENAIHRACKRAGLRLIGWHVLRHTFASTLASEGVPLKAIQELLGHSTVVMTMRYAHLAPSSLREAISVLERRDEKAKIETFRQPAVNLDQLLAKITVQ